MRLGLNCVLEQFTNGNVCEINFLCRTCVTVKRYVQDVLFKTEKGCLKNCRNKCIDEPSGNIRRCYTCCAGNLCNDETKPTPSQRPSVTSSSINTTTKKPDGTNAGMMKTSGMYLFFLIFLAQIFFMEFL